MSWWIWLLVGFVLLVAEILTPGGFFVIFFGIGALCVGILEATGIALPGPAQWVLFSLISVGSLLLFRKPLLQWANSRKTDRAVDALEGETAILLEALHPGAVGKAELRGSTWTVRSQSQYVLPKGQRCRVERVDGLTLWVRVDPTAS